MRLTHDAIYNAYELSRTLPNFVRYFRLQPNLLVRIFPQETMEQYFEDAIAAASSDKPLQLLIDTTFKLGDFYVTPLLFRYSAFENDPVIPIAFLIHENKYPEDHEEFLLQLQLLSEEFRTNPDKVVFISDREFNFSGIFPETKHVYCWLHMMENVRRWLDKRTLDKAVKDKYYADVRKLLKKKSLKRFEKEYEELRKSWDKKFLKYFDKFLKKDICDRVGRWVIEPLGLYDPHSGITTNAIESFNAVMKRWLNWKEMPLDCLILALHKLVEYS